MELKGIPASPGIVAGEAYLYSPQALPVQKERFPAVEVPLQLEAYRQLRQKAKRQLEALRRRLERQGQPERAEIFAAHIDILFDTALNEEIGEMLEVQHFALPWTIHQVYEKYIHLLRQAKDGLIRERADDLRDVKNRLLRLLAQAPEESLRALCKPVVLVAEGLLPSDAAVLDGGKVLAIVTAGGGATSHSAIIARGYQIPALVGVAGVTERVASGQRVIVDGLTGWLLIDPAPQIEAAYQLRQQQYATSQARSRAYLEARPCTADGVPLTIYLNIAAATPQELEGAPYVDGVGLFRTEFLYMGRQELPTEEEQVGIYRRVLGCFGSRPVTLRTLDIGGDKPLAGFSPTQEANPFLGNRGIRFCFGEPEVLRTQLRAALRASVAGHLRILFPMVGRLEDIHRAKGFVEEAKRSLEAQGLPYASGIPVGVMIEVPAIAIMADVVAQTVDFAALGTNDLCQYLTAVDRENAVVTEYYQPYHPAVFRLLRHVTKEFVAAGKPLCLCGELGSDPLALGVLVGLGLRQLSMSLASVASTKRLLAGLTVAQAERLAAAVMQMSDAGQVKDFLREELRGFWE